MKRAAIILVATVALAFSTTASAVPTPVEAAWLDALNPTTTSLVKAGQEVGRDTARSDVFTRGSKTQVRLVVALAIYTGCGAGIRAAGPAPTPRTARIRASLLTACRYYAKSAFALANGIDNFNVRLIRQATGYMKMATIFIRRATVLTRRMT